MLRTNFLKINPWAMIDLDYILYTHKKVSNIITILIENQIFKHRSLEWKYKLKYCYNFILGLLDGHLDKSFKTFSLTVS